MSSQYKSENTKDLEAKIQATEKVLNQLKENLQASKQKDKCLSDTMNLFNRENICNELPYCLQCGNKKIKIANKFICTECTANEIISSVQINDSKDVICKSCFKNVKLTELTSYGGLEICSSCHLFLTYKNENRNSVLNDFAFCKKCCYLKQYIKGNICSNCIQDNIVTTILDNPLK